MILEDVLFNLINMPNTFIGESSLDIDDCQWIKSLSGRSKVHFKKDTYDYPEYAIYVRRLSNEEALRLIDEIYHKLANYVGDNYAILVMRLPHFIGKDQKHRSIYQLKIQIQLGGY